MEAPRHIVGEGPSDDDRPRQAVRRVRPRPIQRIGFCAERPHPVADGEVSTATSPRSSACRGRSRPARRWCRRAVGAGLPGNPGERRSSCNVSARAPLPTTSWSLLLRVALPTGLSCKSTMSTAPVKPASVPANAGASSMIAVPPGGWKISLWLPTAPLNSIAPPCCRSMTPVPGAVATTQTARELPDPMLICPSFTKVAKLNTPDPSNVALGSICKALKLVTLPRLT